MLGFSIIAQLLSMIIFVAVIVIFVVVIATNLKEKRNNDRSPRLCVPAKVVSKREHVRHHHSGMDLTGGDMMTWNTTYYVTFEFESSDRVELHVPGEEYGILAEGDYGKLTFQGTRYLGFSRE